MKNDIKNRMNTGGALVILVILVVAMSLFAVLAIQSSLNEKRLSTKTKEGIENYYKLDAAGIDEIISTSNNVSSDLTEFRTKNEMKKDAGSIKVEISNIKYEGDRPTLVKYSVINGDKSLNVEIGINGKETSVDRWSTKTKSDNLEYELEITD